VISPILFLIFFNDLKDETANNNNNVHLSLLSDDIAAYTSGRNKKQLNENMQTTINIIFKWSQKWKLNLNPAKCTTTLFSNDSKDATWEANVKVNDHKLDHNPTPTFLGVTYDRVLSFNAHVNNINQKVKTRSNLIRKLANTEWGFEITNLRATYIALCRSCIEYAAAGWAPWLSKTTKEKLEAAQRFACRAITGMVKTTPTDILLIESNLPSITTRINQLTTAALDKAKRLKPDNPRAHASNSTVRKRTKRDDWRSKALLQWNTIFSPHQAPINKMPDIRTPWEQPAQVKFIKAMDKKSQNINTNNHAANTIITDLQSNHQAVAFTDGSAINANRNGGAGVYFQKPEGIPNITARPAPSPPPSNQKSATTSTAPSL